MSIAAEDFGARAFRVVDGEVVTDEEGGLPDDLPACTDPFLIENLTDGPRWLGVLALDGRAWRPTRCAKGDIPVLQLCQYSVTLTA